MPQIPGGSWSPLDAGVPTTISADFGFYLPAGVTLSGTPQVEAIAVLSGTDPDPESRITGGPSIGTVPVAQKGSGAADAAVLVQLTALGAVEYFIWLTCGRSDGTDLVSAWGTVSCNEPGWGS